MLWQHSKVPAISEGTADVTGHGDVATVAVAKKGGSEQDWPWLAKLEYRDPDCVLGLPLTFTPSMLPQQ